MNEINRFRLIIRRWGKKAIRSYPWRYDSEPYRVLISEFMLHRTQTRQVVPIYERFIERYPTMAEYASCGRSQKEGLLSSLGLNWRINGMLNALDSLWETYHNVPTDYEALVSIHGIGQYIAGATICFSQDRFMVLVDSNIVRVIGRVFGLDLKGEARRRKEMIQQIEASVDPKGPRDFYYGIIDLAHIYCRPKNPDCKHCPLVNLPCRYGEQESVKGEIL